MNARVELNTHPIMTLEQAKECGLTASQVRTIARSLERIASRGYEFTHEDGDYAVSQHQETDPSTNRRNAARLRALARQM